MKYLLISGLLLAGATLAQQPTAADMPQEMVWVDRTGKILSRVGAVQNSMFFPELSPDGKFIAVSARDGEVNDRDVWIHDVAKGTKRVVASAKGNDNFPMWMPDGKSIVFTSSRGGNYELWRKPLDPDGPETKLLTRPDTAEYPRAISPDGQTLYFTISGTSREAVTMLFSRLEPRSAFPPAGRAWRDGGQYAPNGRYLAYHSNEEGPWEVYVCDARDPARNWKVSRELANGWAGGGGQVRWRADGKELFYIMGNDTMLSVEVDWSGDTPKFAAPKRLFALPGMRGNFSEEAPWLAKYAVAADGQRFIFVRTVPK